jgi:uroporphyrinogen-III decarboxylase
MNSRERLQKAIAGRPTDVPAVAPQYLSLYLDERCRRLYEAVYVRKLASAAEAVHRVDHAEDSRLRAEAILGAYEVFSEQPDWIHTVPGESRAWAQKGEIHLADGRCTYVDRASGEATSLQEANCLLLPTSMRHACRVPTSRTDVWDETAGLRTRADIDALCPVRTADELERDGIFEVTRGLAQAAGDRVSISCIAPTPFWSTYGLLGFQGMMVMMRESPGLFCYLMERRHRQHWETLKGLARAGVDTVWVEECLSSADLISPGDYERFAFSTTQRFIQDANELGLTVILYYCGDVMPRLPWLKRLGMAALAVEESKKAFAVDIGEVIKRAGDVCCIFGNVDSIHMVHEGSAETLAADVDRQLRLGALARGFVLCQGSPFPLETDPKKIDLLIRYARRNLSLSYQGASHEKK